MKNYVAHRIHFIILVSQSKQAIFSPHKQGHSRIPPEVILYKTRIGTREVGQLEIQIIKSQRSHKGMKGEIMVNTVKAPRLEKAVAEGVGNE